jgi:prevent-host-death family protein
MESCCTNFRTLPVVGHGVHLAILAKTNFKEHGNRMETLTAKDAKYSFGRLIDIARTKPVAVTKHGRPVIVVIALEEFERLKALDAPAAKRKRKE